MKYFEVNFRIAPIDDIATDILAALLADEGFEAFEPHEDGLVGWIQQSQYTDEGVKRAIDAFLLPDTTITYSLDEAPDENWNRQWEQEGFIPIIIYKEGEPEHQPLIVIHDTVHIDVPEAVYDIRINPCQAFGTGSHETTRMILRRLLTMHLRGRHVIDAGTGTGILSILCNMLGAAEVLAYDIDEWSVRNAQDNLRLNGIGHGVSIVLGDSTVLFGRKRSDLIIANINRNILLSDMQVFASCLEPGGELLLSGFYTNDVPVLLDEAKRYGFVLTHQAEDRDWALLVLKKEKSS
ncbi:MAG: 50S ribosomal protein L11 methyltransferase [Bacteroidaceae bacterium]|nr:50S ribosomal protein L11 methyltransferase [Bacteroidaceae bacterium]